jgi:hypothetical protein
MRSQILRAQQRPQQVAKQAHRNGGAQDKVEHVRQTLSQAAA